MKITSKDVLDFKTRSAIFPGILSLDQNIT